MQNFFCNLPEKSLHLKFFWNFIRFSTTFEIFHKELAKFREKFIEFWPQHGKFNLQILVQKK